MPERPPVIVVGAGVGGLAAAVRLRAAGHDVVVLERNEVAGGKLAQREVDGFTFDTGPSLLTLPGVFRDLFAVAGADLDQRCELTRLDPVCRYRFSDGSGFDVRADLDATVAEVEALGPGLGARYRAFVEHGRAVWEVAERTFFTGPIESPLRLLRRMRSPADLAAIDPLPTLAGRAARILADPRLEQWAGRFATYGGSSPYRAPATLACIAAIEQDLGAWHVRGGLGTLGAALVALAREIGVDVRTSAGVSAITTAGEAVTGVRLADGTTLAAPIVVANVDADHLYRDLLPDPRSAARVARAGRSSSGFALLVAVPGRTTGLAHHNVGFSADYRREFADIFDAGRGVPADPTVYVCNPAATDPTCAPAGSEAWFVLVNVAAGAPVGSVEEQRVLSALERHGWGPGDGARVVGRVTPADLAARYRSAGGAIYGTSSNGRRAAFARPGNRGPRRGLYLAGGSSHPGGGLPLVAMSGRIVADMIERDTDRSRRSRRRWAP